MRLTRIRLEEIEGISADLLKDCFTGNAIIPPIDLNPIIRKSGLQVRLGLFKNPNTDGAFDRTNGIIFLSRNAPRARQVSTAAHELGHFYLHKKIETEVFNRQIIPSIDSDEQTEEEQEADWFSACLLMPRPLIDRFLEEEPSAERLSEQFDVPTSLVVYRLKYLGLLSS